MRLNFTLYGSQFTYGWLPDGATLIDGPSLVREAIRRGFSGVEIPARVLETATTEHLTEMRALIDANGLEAVISAFGTDVDYLRRSVDQGEILGAQTVRTVVGGADYGGDRRKFAGGGWRPFMAGVRERLAVVLRHASVKGISLAVENHQDVASEDLLWLCESFDSPYFGVVLDTANPLSTAEHPIQFALDVMPWIKYVHLKDYRIYWSREGYRLVRCPVGSGVIPFAELIPLLRKHGRAASASLEIAALEQRHVRLFEPDFWPEYEPRPATQLAEVLRFVRQHALPEDVDYRTPFEKGAPAAEVAEFEEEELRASIPLVAALTGDQRPVEALGRSGREPVAGRV